jgi:hypothetical protein
MFQLLAEQFDNGLFQILAWRGREREELTGRMHAADGGRAGKTIGLPLTEMPDTFLVVSVTIPARRVTVARELLLHQVPIVDVTVRSRRLAEVLRPAKEPENHKIAGAAACRSRPRVHRSS